MKQFSKRINLVSDTIDKKDLASLSEWMLQDETPKLTKGPLTIEFEKKWSSWLGVKGSVFVNSGSSAILLALASLKEAGYLKSDKIVVPTLSWLTDVSSPMQIGLSPILCDCNLYDLSVDINHLEKIFAEENPSAFILVSALGLVPDMDKISKLCKEYDVLLIEDVCESMGSSYNGQKLGTHGIVSLFSFYYGHHLSTIEGGMISTNDEELLNIMISMRSHGWDRDWTESRKTEYRQKHNVSEFDAMYTFYYPGYNLRSTDLQAFIGIMQIDKLDNFIKTRQKNFFEYENMLRNINGLDISVRPSDCISNFAYPFLAPTTESRNRIVKALMQNDVEVRPLIAGSMGKKPFWVKHKGYSQSFNNADQINILGFYIPNHQDLTVEDISLVTKIIKENI
jgi:CDP-6-deoxy-D-xylo-4-hexulose-3-dehydrase